MKKIIAVAVTFVLIGLIVAFVIYTNGQGSARSPYEQCIRRYVEQLTDRATTEAQLDSARDTARIWCYKKSPQARDAAEARD